MVCMNRRPADTTAVFADIVSRYFVCGVVDTAAISQTVGVTQRSVQRWAANKLTPNVESSRRLQELDEVLELGLEVMRPDALRRWRRRPNSDFGDSAPLAEIAAGRHHRVVGLLLSLAEGVID